MVFEILAGGGAVSGCFVERGCTVETVPDGLEGMRRMRQNPYLDVSVVKVDMPWGGDDGVLACLAGETSPPNHGSATGNALPQVLSERTGVPIACCLQKPLQIDALLNLVRREGTVWNVRGGLRQTVGHGSRAEDETFEMSGRDRTKALGRRSNWRPAAEW